MEEEKSFLHFYKKTRGDSDSDDDDGGEKFVRTSATDKKENGTKMRTTLPIDRKKKIWWKNVYNKRKKNYKQKKWFFFLKIILSFKDQNFPSLSSPRSWARFFFQSPRNPGTKWSRYSIQNLEVVWCGRAGVMMEEGEGGGA